MSEGGAQHFVHAYQRQADDVVIVAVDALHEQSAALLDAVRSGLG